MYTHAYFGTWLPTAGYRVDRVPAIMGLSPALLDEYSWTEQILGTFFDLDGGVFVYSLFLVPLLIVVPAGWRRSPDWARGSALAGLVYWVVQLRGNRFTGGGGFIGYRFPLDPLWLMAPLLLVGAAAWFARNQWVRRSTLGAGVVSIGWMIALWMIYPTGTVDGGSVSERLSMSCGVAVCDAPSRHMEASGGTSGGLRS